jgi:hypothetical protein
MKKIIALVILCVIGFFQLKYFNPVQVNIEGIEGYQEEITENKISFIQNDEFSKIHSSLYPNDKIVMLDYTLKEEVESMRFLIQGDIILESMKVEPGRGTIIILITENELSIIHKTIEVVDLFTENTFTTTLTRGLDVYVPEGKEIVMIGFSNPTSDIMYEYNEELELCEYTLGYHKDNDGLIEEVSLDFTVEFRND